MNLYWQEEIPVREEYDVIVAGGGIAGVAAALQAARCGMKTMLLEKQTWLGGLATNGLINFWEPLDNGRGKIVMHGMVEELFRESIRYGYDNLPETWKNGIPIEETEVRCVTNYSSGIFALVMLKLLLDAGARVLYDVVVSQPVMEGTHCTGVIIEGKSGREMFPARIVIDATGDADLLQKAGAPTIDGTNYFTYFAEGLTLDSCRRAVEKNDISFAYEHFSGGTSDLHGNGHPDGMPYYCGTGTETINRYLQQNQLELLRKQKGTGRMSRSIHLLPCMPQFRTIRRLKGVTTFTAQPFAFAEDSVGVCADFEYGGWLYEVPYSTMYSQSFDNLLTCGRTVSADGRGWDVLRVIPSAVLTGQAAGAAAALAVASGRKIAEIRLEALQKTLSDTGTQIHIDPALITDCKPEFRNAR